MRDKVYLLVPGLPWLRTVIRFERIEQNGAATDVFVVNFFYNVLDRKRSVREAWQRAMVATDHPEIYQMSLYHTDGSEERFE